MVNCCDSSLDESAFASLNLGQRLIQVLMITRGQQATGKRQGGYYGPPVATNLKYGKSAPEWPVRTNAAIVEYVTVG